MAAWTLLAHVLFLLGAGFVLGAVAERLRQSAILGYLAAGMLLGPHGLHWAPDPEKVTVLAELGVALLLFSIGLEFPWNRLKRSGAALAAGGLQVTLTLGIGAGLALLFGADGAKAYVIGAMLALSSTAYVLRLLTRRGSLDSPHGRLSIDVLLAQDVAVVPLLLIGTVLVAHEPLGPALLSFGRLIGLALLLAVVFRVLFHVAAPRLLGTRCCGETGSCPSCSRSPPASAAPWPRTSSGSPRRSARSSPACCSPSRRSPRRYART